MRNLGHITICSSVSTGGPDFLCCIITSSTKEEGEAPSCSSTSSHTVQESMRLFSHSGFYWVMYLQRGPCPLGQASPYNWLLDRILTTLSRATMCSFLLTAAQQNRLKTTIRKCYGKNEWIGFCNICLLCSFRHLPENGIVGSQRTYTFICRNFLLVSSPIYIPTEST